MTKIIEEKLNGLKLIQLDIYTDNRGYFSEKFKKSSFEKIGITGNFIQDNFSFSKAGVIRGLHYQKKPDQAKLVSVTRGKIIDIAVDIRCKSPSFGQHYAAELSAENGRCLYIPAGFAHGFCALTDADVIYKVDGEYNKEGEGGIAFNDAELAIKWPVTNIISSEKDTQLQSFAQYKTNPAF